ncbi:hypothetical protein [Methylocystis rosea]|uniref:Uncharacterized protein n=1 Tax=Methylocystis rosea TaxID=173366 RepID=A0A3G8M9I6_9HYPH|nr:hypothetical protein [Methylocystis rosea]AZG78154.1 hypothetical protein EHO51_16225 [Methylocystis rosea]
MAKKPQSATAPDQSPASAENSAAQAESPATENRPSPPPEAKTPPKPERKSFVAVFNVVDGAKTYAPGETATLTRAQFDELKPLGAIEGDWN